ncbi:MAG: tetratricopeptide repeat protein [Candidatus Thorarchaeota archaeon]|nr:tetratricopeptide repeat protein [Candidatus Thorarchaeota archaeon]
MPKNIDEIISQAEELCVLCEEEEAEEIVRSALVDNPKNIDLKTELAIVLSRRGHDKKAEAILREVLEEDPLHMRATSALGNFLENSLRSDEAETLFRSFLTGRPHGHVVLDDLCRLLFDNERVEESLEVARSHIRAFPTELAAYDALRYVLARQEDDLAADLAEDPEDVSRIQRYAENILEQYSNLKWMQDSSLSLAEGEEDIIVDIREDVLRVSGEMADIKRRLERAQIVLSDAMMTLLNSGLQETTTAIDNQ